MSSRGERQRRCPDQHLVNPVDSGGGNSQTLALTNLIGALTGNFAPHSDAIPLEAYELVVDDMGAKDLTKSDVSTPM